MKILFTGGGTGGHFYPIIAVAEAVNDIAQQDHLVEPLLYFAASDPYDRDALITQNIQYIYSTAGKTRRYFSILNYFGMFKTGFGVVWSMFRTFFLYPDVVFGKGGYESFPSLLAARMFGIPVVIHESDATPGRVNKWAGKFAAKIAVSYPEAAEFFPKEKVAFTGNPVRKAALIPAREGAFEFLKMDPALPVLLILGGSQGAQAINEAILTALPQLVEKYQIIHQTGINNFEEVQGRAKVALEKSMHAERYHAFGYLNDIAMRMSAGVATLVISRAGSTIFELASWGTPSILIPLPSAAEDHQTKNAYSYARAGGCEVIDQNNLTPGLLVAEVARLLGDKALLARMSQGARAFARPDAAKVIARALLDIGLSHES